MLLAFGDQGEGLAGVENPDDCQWCQKWWQLLLKPIVAEEAQMQAQKQRVQNPEATVVDSQGSTGQQCEREGQKHQAEFDLLDSVLLDEQQIRDELERLQRRFEDDKLRHELELYGEDGATQEASDLASLEVLDASCAQAWDDRCVWDAMNSAPRIKRQRLILHVRMQGNFTAQEKMEIVVRPGEPVTTGLTWTVVDMEETPSSASTAAVAPCTDGAAQEAESGNHMHTCSGFSSGSMCTVKIPEAELGKLMCSNEGQSVFRA